MSRAVMRRLERLEGSLAPVLGHMHVIYAQDEANYETQREGLMASGRAAAADFIMDWNHGIPAERHEAIEPESFPVTRTHEEWVDILARPECQQ
jgi:hypothetical protein